MRVSLHLIEIGIASIFYHGSVEPWMCTHIGSFLNLLRHTMALLFLLMYSYKDPPLHSGGILCALLGGKKAVQQGVKGQRVENCVSCVYVQDGIVCMRLGAKAWQG